MGLVLLVVIVWGTVKIFNYTNDTHYYHPILDIINGVMASSIISLIVTIIHCSGSCQMTVSAMTCISNKSY